MFQSCLFECTSSWMCSISILTVNCSGMRHWASTYKIQLFNCTILRTCLSVPRKHSVANDGNEDKEKTHCNGKKKKRNPKVWGHNLLHEEHGNERGGWAGHQLAPYDRSKNEGQSLFRGLIYTIVLHVSAPIHDTSAGTQPRIVPIFYVQKQVSVLWTAINILTVCLCLTRRSQKKKYV